MVSPYTSSSVSVVGASGNADIDSRSFSYRNGEGAWGRA